MAGLGTLLEAGLAMQCRQLRDCIRLGLESARARSDSPDAFALLGHAYLLESRATDDPEACREAASKSQRCLQRALELDPTQPLAGRLFVDMLLRAASAPVTAAGEESQIMQAQLDRRSDAMVLAMKTCTSAIKYQQARGGNSVWAMLRRGMLLRHGNSLSMPE